MEVEYKSSYDYIRQAEMLEEMVSRDPEASFCAKEDLEIRKRKVDVLKSVEAVTGLRFDVMIRGPKNIGGMAKPEEGRVLIADYVLGSKEAGAAVKIAGHEKMHMDTKICELDFERRLKPNHLNVLKNFLGISRIEKEFFMEGFTELLTARKYGFNSLCLYNENEVPAAEKLENLCMVNTGCSLAASFERGDEGEFFKRLEVLCEVLSVKEKIGYVLN